MREDQGLFIFSVTHVIFSRTHHVLARQSYEYFMILGLSRVQQHSVDYGS